MVSDATEPNSRRPKLDEEQDVEGLEPHGLHGGQVGRDDAGGLGSKECPPRRGRPSGRWPKPVPQQHCADGGGRHLDPELLQFTLDTLVAPAGVLLSQSQDQCNQVLGQRWTTASTVGLGPVAGDQPAVPPQDRVRGHQKARPALTRKRSAQRREQRTIGGREPGSLDLTAQRFELMASHRDLDVLDMLALEAPKQDAEESARHEVQEG
jgi:hypothetical protein